MKIIVFFLLVLLLSLSACEENPVRAIEFGAGDDYDVYRTLLTADFGSSRSLIVLSDSTGSTVVILDSAVVAGFRNSATGLSDETMSNFISANKTRSKLAYIEGVDHLVLDSDYNDGRGGGTVRVGLSKIGYDSTRTQAVVEIGVQWAPLAGRGSLVYLSKEDGLWVVRCSYTVWIS